MVVRVGVIGAGNMGADHVRTLHASVTGADVEVVADIDTARARSVAATVPGARATGDAHALIADPRVDAVVVASHDPTHPDLSIACVRAGKPVLCEKPLASTVAECLRVVAAESAVTRPLVSVGFMRRFDPGYGQLRAVIAAGSLGAPLLVHCISRGVSSYPGTTSESLVTNSAIHDFDVVPWLLGTEVVEVGWQAPRSTSRAEGFHDPQLISLRTADGVLTTVEVFLNARYGYDIRCEVVGELGAASLTEPVRLVTDLDRRRSTAYPADWRPRFADAYRRELQAWIDAIVAGAPSPLADAHDGLVAGAVAAAVIESMHGGGRVVAVRVPSG
jgi:myo-inositol 2-dehydrogenase/D-chiro-inositol 1-dehydrogenase